MIINSEKIVHSSVSILMLLFSFASHYMGIALRVFSSTNLVLLIDQNELKSNLSYGTPPELTESFSKSNNAQISFPKDQECFWNLRKLPFVDDSEHVATQF